MYQIDPDRKLKVLWWWLHGLGVLVVTGIALFAEFAVFRPIDDQTAANIHEARQLQTFLRDKDRVRSEHARLAKELAVARGQAATLQARIPDEPREADFLAQASKLAGQIGLQIQDYRPSAISSKQSYSTVRVDLICQGGYASICSFLDRLSKLPRHSTVTRLRIDANRNRPVYSVQISVTLYFVVNGQPSIAEKEATDA